MAFILQNFQFGRGILTAATQGQGYTTVAHSYKSSDTMDAINTANYFPPFIDGEGDKIFVGDLLDICASDGTSRVRIDSLSPFTYGADLYSASGSSLVVGAPQAGFSGDGANISGTTLHMEYANATRPGIISIGNQTMGAGVKSFTDPIDAVGGLYIGGSPVVLENYDEYTFTTTFFNNTITTSAANIKICRVGSFITLRLMSNITSGAQATPAATFTATTNIPSQFRFPTGDYYGYWPIVKNGVEGRGAIYINNSGALQILADVDSSVTFGNTSNIIKASAIMYNIMA